ncbi:undecaprenyl-diphosphate phosphatase [Geotalea daltonii FRC-32]|uniref:Undecaprenyl-diphosphatase n=1 Tax=Geotalea daltonii (strain DSM 22248 / JCM 15807 / FRC-32) TaxID=316067 RepID=UPPP_GEODF|nr:undecaprenyl-diphosphate phosphatase [Geotalea daltonii]B9M0D1.1 RecName: Full=Undecaprenyl-diphosphatase; AltName: Full=Bacitracin resistance protein; AltName: Full=Undecaprenyl pyrophosphate phosphatase [Geotalea daltonii FRC-32]ACM18968.1 undecaprenyl-diphosphate phosphatase [Geotalea daltonii FRC-32]
MDLFQATILGIVQGLTEVLPISSSAHLILIPTFLKWPESGITFDVALHLGTFIALCLYFWRDLIELASDFFTGMADWKHQPTSRRLPFYIIAGTFPAAIVGKLFETTIEELFRKSPSLIALFLIVFALLLAFADTSGSKKWKIEAITLKSAIIIGLAQCLALIPGVSRSGITITAALLLGFNREAAARFSFLLSLPIVAGAALFELSGLLKTGIPPSDVAPLLIGIATSAVFGYISVAFLLKMVQRSSLYPFVWYRIAIGCLALVFINFG